MNPYNYKILKTKHFLNKNHNQSNINKKFFIDILQICYQNCSFSTLPYFMYQLNSEKSIEKTNSGNCIGLSIFIKKYLKKNYNIMSYLIPCTIPNMYKKPNMLDISHVSLAIPKNNKLIYIIDPAFYFYEPILVNLDNLDKTQYITSVNIYSDKITPIIAKTHITNKDIVYNNYQTIKENTYYSKCHYIHNTNDQWNYFLTEICNPDESISNFFLNITRPFISTTKFENGLCKMDFYLKFMDNNTIKIEIDNKPFFYGDPKYISKKQLKIIRSNMKNFYDSNLELFLYQNNSNTFNNTFNY